MKKKKSKEKSTKKSGPQKAPFKFYLIMALIPVAFFIVLELILRIIGYGNDYSLFISGNGYNPKMLHQNREIAFKYFDNIENSNILPEGFSKVKKAGTFRVFVLGASSAAGFPYNQNCSFSRHLQRKLDLLYPNKIIEVVNLSHTAINSYTILDYIPDVLDQEPDLILFYAGHNEYYGALGVASANSLGGSRFMKKFNLWLRNFEISELFRNIYQAITMPSAGEESEEEGEKVGGFRVKTVNMMERMIKEAFIPFGSDLYEEGLTQFGENFREILTQTKNAGVPVVIGTLVCNLKNQRPFYAEGEKGYKEAIDTYEEGQKLFKLGDYSEALKKYIKSKELDGVRFRAPERINEIIIKIAKEYGYPLADARAAFESNSPHGIIGDNLIIDHLHPNFYGYRLLGDVYFNAVKNAGFLPGIKPNEESIAKTDSVLAYRYPLTELDSAQTDFMMRILKGSYPYVKKEQPNRLLENFKPRTFIDTAALVLKREARGQVASWYAQEGMFDKFKKEIYILAEQAPFNKKPFNDAVALLKDYRLYSRALPYISQALNEVKSNEAIAHWKSIIDKDLAAKRRQENPEIKARQNIKAEALKYYKAGFTKMRSGDLEGALPEYNKALQLDTSYYDALIDRAYIHMELNQNYVAAIADVFKAIDINPRDERAFVNGAAILFEMRQYPKALELLNKAVIVNPSNGRSFYLMGLVYMNMNDKDKACESWEQASALGDMQAVEMLGEHCN